jgi:tetratricopeptide (TPR) repeat protein
LNQNRRAIEDYTAAIKLRLDRPEYYKDRALLLAKVNQLDEAVEDLTHAVNYNPNYFDAVIERAFIYGQMGKFESAVSDLDIAIKLNPKSARAYGLRGEAFRRMGDAPKALSDFTNALQLDPNNIDVYLSRGSAYILVREFEKALADRDKAVQLGPGNAEAYVARGGSYHLLGQHEKGLADRTEAIRLKPGMPEAWHARCSALFLLGDYDKAAGDCREAVRLNPNYQEAKEVLARTEDKIQERRAAATQPPPAPAPPPASAPATVPVSEAVAAPVTAAIETTKPKLSEPALLKAGRALLDDGHYQAAIDVLSKAIAQNPSDAIAYNSRGFAYLKTSEYEKALSDFDAALRLKPDYTNASVNRKTAAAKLPAAVPNKPPAPKGDAATLYARGRKLLEAGDFKQAIIAFTDVLQFNSAHSRAFNSRGYCHLRLKNYKAAIADFDAALRIDPKYENASHNRATALKALK